MTHLPSHNPGRRATDGFLVFRKGRGCIGAVVAAAGLLLVACNADPVTSSTTPRVPRVEPSAPAVSDTAPSPTLDRCGAASRQGWIGQTLSHLPPTPPNAEWRRVCTTCQKTDDFRPDRLNIVYDAADGRIVSLSCG